MDGQHADPPGDAPAALEPENDLSRAYRVIAEALAPLPYGVGLSLMTSMLAELLIEATHRGLTASTPSHLARIGRDGLYSSIVEILKEREMRVTLADPGVGGAH